MFQPCIFPVASAQDLFSAEWFIQLFKTHPILKRFVTTQMIISTDELASLNKLTKWQNNLYQALATLGSYEVNCSTHRYSELERTIFSIMFIEAIRLYKMGGREFIQSLLPSTNTLTDEDYQKIHKLFKSVIGAFDTGGAELELFKLSCIFGDIAKIHAIREILKSPTADQDLALDYILSLDTSILLQCFTELSQDELEYLKKWRFPLHLGHAAQSECAYSKFQEVLDVNCNVLHAKYAIAKQISDVAGARAQNGILLLNTKILQTYLVLLNTLEKLIDEGKAYDAYKQYLDLLVSPTIFKTLEPKNLYVIQRLFCQLRLQQMSPENFADNSQLVLQAFYDFSKAEIFQEYSKILNEYDNTKYSVVKFIHTPTYVPAIFSSLINLYNPEDCLNIANNKYTFALLVGCKLVSAVLTQYLEIKKTNVEIINNPPCFNKLNGLIAKDLQLALQLFVHTEWLNVANNGDILIHQENSCFTSRL